MLSTFVTVPLSKMLYGWTKWGGGNRGIVREFLDVWHCQICAEEQSVGMPKYFYPLDERKREFLSVCSGCWNEIRKTEIDNFEDLLNEVRNFKEKRIEKLSIILSMIENLTD